MKYLVLIAVALAAVAAVAEAEAPKMKAPKMKPAAGFEMPTSGKFKDSLKRRAIKSGVETLMEARDNGADVEVPRKMFSPAHRVMKNRPGAPAPFAPTGADLSKFKSVFNKDLHSDMMTKLRETKEVVAKTAAEKK